MNMFIRFLLLLMIATSVFFSIGAIVLLTLTLLGVLAFDIGALLLLAVTAVFAMLMMIFSIWGYVRL